MPPVRKVFKRKMTAVEQKIVSSWDNGKGDGKETHLWKVWVVDEEGKPIEEEFRAFAELELNIPYEYEVEPYNSEKHGRTYTIKKPRANTTKRVGELENQLQSALERIAAIEQHVGLAPPS